MSSYGQCSNLGIRPAIEKGNIVETQQEIPPTESATAGNPRPPGLRQSLPPKGSCWYCEKPLDAVRRFCGKECADSFDEEAEFTR
jgi:hypothetical protein